MGRVRLSVVSGYAPSRQLLGHLARLVEAADSLMSDGLLF